MSERITINQLEIRELVTEKGEPEYVIRGYACVPDAIHTYKVMVDKKGNQRPLKSLFTNRAIESMRHQMKSKKVFIDVEHETALNMNIRSLLLDMIEKSKKAGLNFTDEVREIESMLKGKEVSIAKVSDFNIDEKGLFVETKLNPFFKELSPDHKKYFEAIWGSFQNKFIDGLSINFLPTALKVQNIGGQVVDMIDGVDFFGISYTSGAAVTGSDITEVFTRSMALVKETGEDTMTENTRLDNTKFEDEISKLKLELQARDNALAEIKQREYDNKLNAEKEAQKQQMAALQKEMEELRAVASRPTAKGVVSNHAAGTAVVDEDALINTISENAKKLSLGELIEIQGQFSTLDSYPPETRKLLAKEKSDIVAERTKK